MTKQTPEGRVKTKCREWMRARGAYIFSPVQFGMGAATVDDLVCYLGKFIGIEYKRPDTRPEPTPRQILVLRTIADAGGISGVAYDLEDVKVLFAKVEADVLRS